MSEQVNHNRSPFSIEQKPSYRADTDQNGDWYVWRRLGPNGWATLRRCENKESAIRLAETLNGSGRLAV